MANNGLKTFEDVMNYLSYLEKKYEKIENELKELKIGFFSAEKKQMKAKKSKMLEELDRISNLYDQYDKLFKDATTFERKDLAPFLAKYFTLYYGKTYEVQYGVRDTSESKYAKSCDFIASSEDFARIDKNYDLETPINLDDVLNLCKDNCLSLGGSKAHTLLADSELNSEFSAFPEIIEVAKRLINIKLANPSLNDKQRLEVAIRDIATENTLQHQESELAASVREETEPKINILRRTDQTSSIDDEAPAKKISIINRTDIQDSMSQQTTQEKPFVSTSTSTFRPLKPQIVLQSSGEKIVGTGQSLTENNDELFGLERKIYENLMQSEQVRKLQESIVIDSQQPETVVNHENPETSGGKKLSKSMMGIYMNKR